MAKKMSQLVLWRMYERGWQSFLVYITLTERGFEWGLYTSTLKNAMTAVVRNA